MVTLNDVVTADTMFIVVDPQTGVVQELVPGDDPVCTLYTRHHAFQAHMDTGSPFTIINPPRGCDTDPIFDTPEGQLISTRALTLKGVGGGRIHVDKFANMWIGVDAQQQVQIAAAILPRHYEGMPRVLLGRDVMMKAFGGHTFEEKVGSATVTFHKWPQVELQCVKNADVQHAETVSAFFTAVGSAPSFMEGGDISTADQALLATAIRDAEGDQQLQPTAPFVTGNDCLCIRLRP
jgi:hypothetical protein